MRRKSIRLLSIVIALIIVITSGYYPMYVFAWDTDDLTSTTWPYFNGWTGGTAKPYGSFSSITCKDGSLLTRPSGFGGSSISDVLAVIDIGKNDSSVLEPVSFYSDMNGQKKHTSSFKCLDTLPADFSEPVMYKVQASDGRSYPMFILALNINGDRNTENELNTIIDYSSHALISIIEQYNAKLDSLYQQRLSGELNIGDYHPVHFNLLYYIGRKGIEGSFGSSIDEQEYHLLTDLDTSLENAQTVLANVLWQFTEQHNNFDITFKSLDYYKVLLETVAPFYLDYVENNRISDPVIEDFYIGSSKGIVDKNKKTVSIRFPEGTDLSSLPDPVIVTTGWLKVKQVAGMISSKTVVYSVTPYEESTGIVYDGVRDTYGFNMGTDLSALWKVRVETGDPYNVVTSFAVTTTDGVTREAIIDDENKTITLNLPVGTDLSSLAPTIKHTGTHTNMDDENVDFSSIQTLKIYNSDYNLESDYQVIVTNDKSSAKEIISYSIDGTLGTINGTNIDITIPFATDLSTDIVDIHISEFAEIADQPTHLSEGRNRYVIRAEDGSTVEYIVTITRMAAAKGCSIESFRYGSAKGTIDEVNGTINLELPAGTSLSFAPEITISNLATVEPASGVIQDFAKPVKYTVTAENGRKSIYTVSVSVSDTPVANEYRDVLQSVVDKIITRYRSSASDDWEWMDLGLYQKSLENNSDEFSIANTIGTLDSTTNVAMTNIARKLMTLTARGFNCSKLSQYNEGMPYKDKKGNDIDDLAAVMYNYKGGYTINGPVFALIGLDMGNYTIPENAVWTREKLIETLLAHVYLSDNFGTDMVAAIMYALAPYLEDAVYGDRVRDKLNEGLKVLIKNMESSDYAFKAWGAANSETASWTIMALTAMGIDPYTDPSFSNGSGKNVIQNWVDNYVNESGGYFHHTSSVTNNAMATYEGCYAAMWYLGFLDNGGAGHPYSLYYHRFDFSTVLSADASILSLEIEGKQGVITEAEENSIVVTLANGTPLTDLKPVITLAEGAKLIAPSLPVTFVEGVKQPFTVCAEDGKTYKTYFVTIVYDDVQASGAELDTDTIELKNSVLNEEAILDKTVTKASDGATEILITVKPGVDTGKMYLSADVSYAATCDPVLDGSTAFDLTDWLSITVTSEDGRTTNVYRIKVAAKAMAEITSFRVEAGGIWYSGEIDNTANTIVVRDVDDSNLTSTELLADIDFTGRTCQPTSGLAMDFAGAVTYTLGGDTELAGRSYIVKVLNKSGKFITAKASGGNTDPSGEPGGNSGSNTEYGGAMILSFVLFGREGIIEQNSGTITITLPQGTNVSAVIPQITVSDGASVSPASGQVVDLSSPTAFTVKHGNETKVYIVSVVFERSTSQQLWDAVMEESDVVDHQISHGRGIH